MLKQDEAKKKLILERLEKGIKFDRDKYLEALIGKKAYEEIKFYESCNLEEVEYYGRKCSPQEALEDLKYCRSNALLDKSRKYTLNPFQKEIRSFEKVKNPQELFSKLSAGEVFKLNNKIMVFDGEKLIELKIPEETFRKLFVTNEFITQGFIGDCPLVSGIDAMMHTPKGKSYIYQLFEQAEGSNDIYINLRGFDKKIKFPNGEFQNIGGMFYGGTGIRMIEQAIAAAQTKNIPSENGIITMYKHFAPKYESMYAIDNGKVVGKGIDWYQLHNYIIGKDNYVYNSSSSFLENIAGKIRGFFNKKNPNSYLLAATQDKDAATISSWNLSQKHAHYSPGLESNGSKIRIVNPHNTSRYASVPLNEAMSNEIFDNLAFVIII